MDPSDSLSEIADLRKRLQSAKLPAKLQEMAFHQLERIRVALKYGGNIASLDMTQKYIDWITSLPWETKTEDTLDINHARTILDSKHFGLQKIKTRILEYLSVLLLQKQRQGQGSFRSPSLFFVGLAGTGKTTLAASIAEAMGRKFERIPFGGLSSPLDLRGQSKVSPEAEPGMIIKALRRAGSANPVILLDELDRITPESRAAIMGILLEILDPGQNANFTDYFIDYPVDLSKVLFIATANNTNNIATAVLDRLELIEMPSYNDEEKITIAKEYILPRLTQEVGLAPGQLTISESLWPKLVRPLGYDSGMRSLERLMEEIARRAAYSIVSGGARNFVVDEKNLHEFTN